MHFPQLEMSENSSCFHTRSYVVSRKLFRLKLDPAVYLVNVRFRTSWYDPFWPYFTGCLGNCGRGFSFWHVSLHFLAVKNWILEMVMDAYNWLTTGEIPTHAGFSIHFLVIVKYWRIAWIGFHCLVNENFPKVVWDDCIGMSYKNRDVMKQLYSYATHLNTTWTHSIHIFTRPRECHGLSISQRD